MAERVKAEYFSVKDKATEEVKEVQFIPPAPSDGDLGGISKEKLEQIDKLKSDLIMLRAQAGIFVNESDILGVQVDYKNKTFTRLAGATNLTKGSDFDRFSMFGGRRRCNVADDGTIVAWCGDAGAFCWNLDNGVGSRGRSIGGRLVYIPTKDSSVYNAAIASWKEQMAA